LRKPRSVGASVTEDDKKNLNRRAIEESSLRLTIGLPLESEAEATQGFHKAPGMALVRESLRCFHLRH
jgi:hypothetical protein